MLRVYLDQNKWIDLARAAKGEASGARFRDVLDLTRASVAAGTVSFPLDISRYVETAKRGSWQSRQELVETMAELSLLHAIAPASVILPAEIDAALYRRFGLPVVPRIAQVFGQGITHAAGGGIRTDGRLELPPGLPAPPGYLAQAEAAMQATLEYCMLLGPSPEMEASPELQAIKAAMTQDVEYARGQTDLAAQLIEHGFSKKEKLDRAMLATELRDILPPVLEALHRAELDPDRFMDTLGRDGLTAFIRDLPTRSVTLDLRRDKHAQGQQPWEPNDLNDIVGLPIAAVYCDVVVTERQWINRMRRARIEQRFGTRLVADLTELLGEIVELTRTTP